MTRFWEPRERLLVALTVVLISIVSWPAAATPNTFGVSVKSSHTQTPSVKQCLAANENSIARRRQLKLRAAREELVICAAPSCPRDIRTECTNKLEALQALQPRVVFVIKDASGADVADVHLSIDGVPLEGRVEQAIELDPGSVVVRVESPGFMPLEKTLLVREGEHDRRELIQLRHSTPAPTHATQTGATQGTTPRPTKVNKQEATSPSVTRSGEGTNPDPETPPSSPWPTLGLVGAGTGIALAGVAAGFTFSAKSKFKASNADGRCDAMDNCDSAGLALRKTAFTHADLATAFAVSGALLFAGGATLFLVSRDDSPGDAPSKQGHIEALAPVISTQGGGFLLRGRF